MCVANDKTKRNNIINATGILITGFFFSCKDYFFDKVNEFVYLFMNVKFNWTMHMSLLNYILNR